VADSLRLMDSYPAGVEIPEEPYALAGTLERAVGILVALVLGPLGTTRITREMAAVRSPDGQEGSVRR